MSIYTWHDTQVHYLGTFTVPSIHIIINSETHIMTNTCIAVYKYAHVTKYTEFSRQCQYTYTLSDYYYSDTYVHVCVCGVPALLFC